MGCRWVVRDGKQAKERLKENDGVSVREEGTITRGGPREKDSSRVDLVAFSRRILVR